jgi:hypothetical protein
VIEILASIFNLDTIEINKRKGIKDMIVFVVFLGFALVAVLMAALVRRHKSQRLGEWTAEEILKREG